MLCFRKQWKKYPEGLPSKYPFIEAEGTQANQEHRSIGGSTCDIPYILFKCECHEEDQRELARLGQFYCSEWIHEDPTLASGSWKSLQNTSLTTASDAVMIFAFEMQTVLHISFFNLLWRMYLPALWVKSHFSVVNKYSSIYYISYSSNEHNTALCTWCSRVPFRAESLLLHIHKHKTLPWRIHTWSLNSDWNLIISKTNEVWHTIKCRKCRVTAYLQTIWILNQTIP